MTETTPQPDKNDETLLGTSEDEHPSIEEQLDEGLQKEQEQEQERADS